MAFDARQLSSSDARLWSLIAQRSEAGADTEAIDRTIWDLFGERWAVVFTDLAGFSRKTSEFGIIHFLQTIYRQRTLLYPILAEHGGLLVKAEGDSMLILFRRSAAAVDCTIAMQRACANINKRLVEEEHILLCVGIGYGDILRIGDEDVWGREVNAASKLGEDLAKTGDIFLTKDARDALTERPDLRTESIADKAPGSPTNFRVVY